MREASAMSGDSVRDGTGGDSHRIGGKWREMMCTHWFSKERCAVDNYSMQRPLR